MEVPSLIGSSRLFAKLQSDQELSVSLLSLRDVAERVANTVAKTVPSFTDHSVRHMDALWRITDQILTTAEIEKLSTAEAFLIATGFYLHDIGMAYAATPEGLKTIQLSSTYESYIAQQPEQLRSDRSTIAKATAFAVRQLHASAAIELSSKPIPGTDVYLFDSKKIREAWSHTCGRIAASHHWNLDKLEQELGSTGSVPLPGSRQGDLAYAACILRLADYSHINRDRASPIDRDLRSPIESESIVHWIAQENIDGPTRDGSELVYRAAVPIKEIDAWWLWYEMVKGLDSEIRSVRRYLDRRVSRQARFSLQGVRGASSPEEASLFVPTGGFLPIEINLRTGSIDRLVQLLAGESLYGPDSMVAVRELIQNARDAVMLKSSLATTEFDKTALSIPIRISLKTNGSTILQVTDPGIGMSQLVMTDYLISIAADYWNTQFHVDFPDALGRGFKPAGKFGIGFLSVFMLGDEVTVESNRPGGERYKMSLTGIARRGEIRTLPSPSGSGTSVRINLRQSVLDRLQSLADLVRAYAPMLPHNMEVDVEGKQTQIPSGWLQKLSVSEFHEWTLKAIRTIQSSRNIPYFSLDDILPMRSYRFHESPESVHHWLDSWPEYSTNRIRLVTSFRGVSLLSLRGLSIQPISTPGFVGVIDLDYATPDVSRRRAISADVSEHLARAIAATRTGIISDLNGLASRGLLIDQLEFFAECGVCYGRDILLETTAPWISLIRLPGEISMINCATLLNMLKDSKSLFFAYGIGPWTAMRRWASSGTDHSVNEPAILIDDVPMDRVGFRSEELIGTLASLKSDCQDGPLMGTILRLTAEAWQVDLQELVQQDGWHASSSGLWGRVSRP